MSRVLTIDWSKEESLDLPEGRYLFKVVEADTGESAKGDPQIVLTLMVVSPKKHKGRKQKVWLTINPKSLRFVRQACEAILGKEMPKSAAKLVLDKFLGKLVYAEAVKNGEYTNITNWEAYSDDPGDDDDEAYDDDDEPGDDDESGDDDEPGDDDELPWDDDDEEEDESPKRRPRR